MAAFSVAILILLNFSVHITQCKDIGVHEEDSNRISGGIPANLGDIPYQATLRLISTNAVMCGGVLISLLTVLTAAHCLRPGFGNIISPSEFRVVSEITQLHHAIPLEDGGPAGQVRDPYRVIVHYEYSPRTSSDNDIGLVILRESFTPTATLRSIPWRTARTKENEWCTISGFGSAGIGSEVGIFRYAEVKIANLRACAKDYNATLPRRTVTGNMVCAGGAYRGVCDGDGGAPLVCRGVLVGLASFGKDCGKSLPDVYTEVARYTKWIMQNDSYSTKGSVSLVGMCVLLANSLLHRR